MSHVRKGARRAIAGVLIGLLVPAIPSLLAAPAARAAATKVVITTAAAGPVAGTAFSIQPVIAIQDDSNSTVTSSNATITATVSGGATLVGTTSVSASSGVATFTNLGITGVAGTSYTIAFSAPGLASATQSLTVTIGAASQLAMTRVAVGAINGSSFAVQPMITVQDPGGNTVTSSSTTVTATVSSGGTLVGVTTAVAASGVATFATLGLTGTIGTTYTISYTAIGLTGTSQSIAVSGVAAALAVATAPAGCAAGVACTTPAAVSVNDANGNRVTASTASITATVSTGATLVGTTTVTAVGGLATFTNLGVAGAVGTAYTVTFSAAGLASATASVTPSAVSGTKLGVTVAASGAATGSPFATPPQVAVQDASGNTVTTGQVVVTAAVSSGAALIGSATATTVGGIATFTGLGISGPIGTYTLTFTSAPLTPATQAIAVAAAGTIAPSVTSVNPATGSTMGGTVVTITGTNFTGVTSVSFGGVPASNLVVVSATQITVKSPSRPAGVTTIYVSNGTATGSLANGYTYAGGGAQGVPIGGGVYLWSSSDSPDAEGTDLVRVRTSLGSANRASVQIDQGTRVRVSGLPKSRVLNARMLIDGAWVSIGQARTNSQGRAALRAVTITVSGSYPVRLTRGGRTFYVTAVA